jgi:hypothetical protein
MPIVFGLCRLVSASTNPVHNYAPNRSQRLVTHLQHFEPRHALRVEAALLAMHAVGTHVEVGARRVLGLDRRARHHRARSHLHLSPRHTFAETTALLKVDTKCTAPSLIPTVNGNTFRSFSTHGQPSAAQGRSTTVSRSDIR